MSPCRDCGPKKGRDCGPKKVNITKQEWGGVWEACRTVYTGFGKEIAGGAYTEAPEVVRCVV